MTTRTEFRLDIAPMPTPRPRTRVITMPGRRPLATIYSPKEYKDWQTAAAAALRDIPPFHLDGPCSVSIVLRAARPKTTKLPAPKWDVDNGAKSVLDAITKDGRFWTDDSQVVSLFVRKEWTTGEPGILVSIAKDQ